MAKPKLDLPTQLPDTVARPLYASVGVTDRFVEAVREYVTELQKHAFAVQKDLRKTVSGIDYQPQALREQASKVVTAGVESLNVDAETRRKVVETRVVALQAEVRALPTRIQKLIDSQAETAGDTYDDMVKRGETLVARIVGQQSTQNAKASAKTTVAKAKTTKTQATKTAKKSASSAKKTAKKSAAPSSAKATTTSAEKTVTEAAKAATEGAEKIGD